MAEALLRKLAGDHFEVHSAGLEPGEVNPFTVKVLQMIGVDTSVHFSKPLSRYLGNSYFSPIFPGVGQRLHWPFDDPAAFKAVMRKNLPISAKYETRSRQKLRTG